MLQIDDLIGVLFLQIVIFNTAATLAQGIKMAQVLHILKVSVRGASAMGPDLHQYLYSS